MIAKHNLRNPGNKLGPSSINNRAMRSKVNKKIIGPIDDEGVTRLLVENLWQAITIFFSDRFSTSSWINNRVPIFFHSLGGIENKIKEREYAQRIRKKRTRKINVRIANTPRSIINEKKRKERPGRRWSSNPGSWNLWTYSSLTGPTKTILKLRNNYGPVLEECSCQRFLALTFISLFSI